MNNPIHVLQYAPDFRQSLKSVTKVVKKPIKLPNKMPLGSRQVGSPANWRWVADIFRRTDFTSVLQNMDENIT